MTERELNTKTLDFIFKYYNKEEKGSRKEKVKASLIDLSKKDKISSDENFFNSFFNSSDNFKRYLALMCASTPKTFFHDNAFLKSAIENINKTAKTEVLSYSKTPEFPFKNSKEAINYIISAKPEISDDVFLEIFKTIPFTNSDFKTALVQKDNMFFYDVACLLEDEYTSFKETLAYSINNPDFIKKPKLTSSICKENIELLKSHYNNKMCYVPLLFSEITAKDIENCTDSIQASNIINNPNPAVNDLISKRQDLKNILLENLNIEDIYILHPALETEVITAIIDEFEVSDKSIVSYEIEDKDTGMFVSFDNKQDYCFYLFSRLATFNDLSIDAIKLIRDFISKNMNSFKESKMLCSFLKQFSNLFENRSVSSYIVEPFLLLCGRTESKRYPSFSKYIKNYKKTEMSSSVEDMVVDFAKNVKELFDRETGAAYKENDCYNSHDFQCLLSVLANHSFEIPDRLTNLLINLESEVMLFALICNPKANEQKIVQMMNNLKLKSKYGVTYIENNYEDLLEIRKNLLKCYNNDTEKFSKIMECYINNFLYDFNKSDVCAFINSHDDVSDEHVPAVSFDIHGLPAPIFTEKEIKDFNFATLTNEALHIKFGDKTNNVLNFLEKSLNFYNKISSSPMVIARPSVTPPFAINPKTHYNCYGTRFAINLYDIFPCKKEFKTTSNSIDVLLDTSVPIHLLEKSQQMDVWDKCKDIFSYFDGNSINLLTSVLEDIYVFDCKGHILNFAGNFPEKMNDYVFAVNQAKNIVALKTIFRELIKEKTAEHSVDSSNRETDDEMIM